jgi:hypothetical protein
MKLIAAILGVFGLVRRPQTLKRIESSDQPRRIFMCGEHRRHQYASPAAPNAGFDEIAWNLIAENDLATFAQGLRTLAADHRERLLRPIEPTVSLAGIEHRRRPGIRRAVLID